MTRKHWTTYLPPPRPAREIAIAARRIGRHYPANYDNAAPLPCTVDPAPHTPPQSDVLEPYAGDRCDAASLDQ